ncbi:hypothetical protein CBL_00469 [Carabus blaptoides fortunei]
MVMQKRSQPDTISKIYQFERYVEKDSLKMEREIFKTNELTRYSHFKNYFEKINCDRIQYGLEDEKRKKRRTKPEKKAKKGDIGKNEKEQDSLNARVNLKAV